MSFAPAKAQKRSPGSISELELEIPVTAIFSKSDTDKSDFALRVDAIDARDL
jgi:hypothetical protein